ncbi:MAG TPA: alpha/beta hydrolase [Steroidobacteraceae bacterium]|nr:alpha/beta hydrolase [Steroidobacteraceae bacterium]
MAQDKKSRRTPLSTWILRILAASVAVVAVGFGILFVVFSAWKAQHLSNLEAGSNIMSTPLGDIEYVSVGTGVPHLSIHGSPGNYTNALVARKVSPTDYDGVMTIAASRPGYLRTPLTSGKTFEQQADLFAALLDKLGIDRAVVVASSGGGYAALQFALRHPDRCVALVMVSPSVNYEPNPPERTRNSIVRGMQDFGLWLGALSDSLPAMMIKDWNSNDPEQVAFFRELLHGMIPIAPHLDGALNDEAQRIDPNIDRWPLEQIKVPTLLIHGDADENSTYQGSVYVASKVPNAKLVTFAGGDHYIVFTRMHEIREHIRAFVRDQLASRTVQ